MQDKAVLSFTTEQTGQDPSRLEAEITSFLTVLGTPHSSPSSFSKAPIGSARLGICVFWTEDLDVSSGLDDVEPTAGDGTAEVSILLVYDG